MLGATSFIKFQLTAPLMLCEKVEESELKTITPKELPKPYVIEFVQKF